MTLKRTGNIDTKSNNKYSTIIVKNWALYQGNGTGDINEVTTKVTTKITAEVTAKEQQSDNKVTQIETIEYRKDITVSEEIYEHYKKTVRPGAATDAKNSIKKRLNSGFTKEQLIACIDRYSQNGMSQDRQYRIQPQNFFGRAERFKDYLPGKEEPKELIEQDVPQLLAVELVRRCFDSKDAFKWIPGTELVHYRGYKNPLAECQRLGLTRKGVQA